MTTQQAEVLTERVDGVSPQDLRRMEALREHAFQTRLDAIILRAQLADLANSLGGQPAIKHMLRKGYRTHSIKRSRRYDKHDFPERKGVEHTDAFRRGSDKVRKYVGVNTGVRLLSLPFEGMPIPREATRSRIAGHNGSRYSHVHTTGVYR